VFRVEFTYKGKPYMLHGLTGVEYNPKGKVTWFYFGSSITIAGIKSPCGYVHGRIAITGISKYTLTASKNNSSDIAILL